MCFSLRIFINYPATTEIYTLSLHDALPISASGAIDKWVPVDRVSVCSGCRIVPPSRRPLRALLRMSKASMPLQDRKSTRLNSSHPSISYAVFCLKKKKKQHYYQHNTSSST